MSPSTSNNRLSILSSFYTHAIHKCQLLQYNPIERPEPRKVGGDGTFNQVVNGMMNGKKKKKGLVGVLPGGTANVWATEVNVPTDPVKAALTLVSSEARKADVGHVEVTTLTFLSTAQGNEEHPPSGYSGHNSSGKKDKIFG